MVPFASASSILGSAADVLWPLLAAAVFFFLLPELRKVLQSRDFAIEVFGMKLSAQAASDQLAKQIEDLQSRVLELEATSSALAERSQVAPAADQGSARDKLEATTEAPVQAQEERATWRPTRYSGRPRLLWVDDHPENNAYEMKSISSRGWELLVETDTNGAVARFHNDAPFDAVISDLGRNQGGKYDPDAGLNLLREIRSADQYVPILIYTSEDAASSRGKELTDAGATMVTASPIALQQGLARSVGIAFERRVIALLTQHGFVVDQQNQRRLNVDFFGHRGNRVLALETIVVTPRTTLNRLQDATLRLLRAAETEEVNDLLIVTPRPIEVEKPDAWATRIKMLSYDELGGFLTAAG